MYGDEGQQLSPKRFGAKNKLANHLSVGNEMGERTHVKTDEWTDDEQDHTEVPGANIEGGDHDSAADQGKKDRDDNVITVFQSSTGRPRDPHHHKEGDDRRRSLNEIGSGTGESEGSNNLASLLVHVLQLKEEQQVTYGGEEVLVRLCDDQEEVDGGEEMGEWFLHAHPETIPVATSTIFSNATS